ncbi:restriction endonuclease subunit S [Streptomyces bobili]|uniref:Restriction endonuclease subunit S n=1 Tax=Streptomyces bobili TaxID=67280 RepID=A0ABZ1RBY5_9ACTN|nr:restriction endonuclease subunit S [Streptomyces bobili]
MLPLRRLFSVINGGTPTSDPENWGGEVPWATPADFDGRLSQITTTRRTLTPTGARSASAIVPSGSLLVSTRAPIGYIGITSTAMAFNQGCRALVPSGAVDVRFFGYQLEARQLDLQAEGLGTTFLELSSDKLASFRVVAPPLGEQRRIADFLDAETARIDELIHLYGRLSKLASERSQRVLDEAVGQHTDLVPLRYIVRFREGPGIMAADFHPVGVPLIRIAGLKQGKVTLNGCNFLDPEKVDRQWSQFRLRMGDRLISGSATMGGVSVVQDPAVVGSVPYTGLIILRPARADIDMEYVEAFLRSSSFSRQIDLLKTGATMQHFGPTHLSQVKAPLPSPDEQRRVATSAGEALHHASRCNRLTKHQVALLHERRQALITAAVTGQFDVTTASGRNVTEGVSV